MNKSTVKFLQDSLEDSLKILIQKYDSLIALNRFTEAMNIMKNIDLVIRQLRELEKPITKTNDTEDSKDSK